MLTLTIIIFLAVTTIAVMFSMAIRTQEITSKKEVQDRLRYLGKAKPTDQQRKIDDSLLNRLTKGYRDFIKKNVPESYSQSIENMLERADLEISVNEIITLHFLGYLLVTTILLLVLKNIVVSVFLGLIGLSLPTLFIKRKIKKRMKAFDNLLVDTCTLIANILKAGFGLRQSLQVIAEEMPPPVSTEFAKVLQEVQYGLSIEDALLNLTKRVESKDLDLLITAILIQMEIGGNLSEILEKIADTVRDRFRIIGEVNALTAQGKMSGIMVGSLPWLIGVFVYFFNPAYISLLWTTFPGMIVLGCALTLLAMGALIIKAMIKIEF